MSLIHSRYCAPTPSAGEFRRLTTVAFRQALRQAGTIACAPVSWFELDIPVDALTSVMAKLVTAGATPEPPEVGTVRCRLTGTMPTELVAGFEQRLPGMTAGQGVLFSEPAGYEPVYGVPPLRSAGA